MYRYRCTDMHVHVHTGILVYWYTIHTCTHGSSSKSGSPSHGLALARHECLLIRHITVYPCAWNTLVSLLEHGKLCIVRPRAGIISHARSHSALSWEEESTQASLSIHDICTVCPSQFIQILLHLRPLHLFIFTTRHTAHGESGPFNLPCSPPIFLRRQNRNLVRCLP